MSPLTLRPPTKKVGRIPKNKKHELGVQQRVATYLRKNYPQVDFHSDYAAGMFLSFNQARVRRSLESGRGWSDMFIAYPMTHTLPDGTKKTFAGLFLELKRDGVSIYVQRGPRKGQLVSDEQIMIEAAFLKRMNERGYYARFAVGFTNAVKVIDWYMQKPQNEMLF